MPCECLGELHGSHHSLENFPMPVIAAQTGGGQKGDDMTEEVSSIREAIPLAVECINKACQNDGVSDIMPANKRRHFFIMTGNGLTYWLLYKREFFKSFGKIFGYKGPGESINKEWVERAIGDYEVTAFIFVYPKGYVYIIPPEELKRFAEENGTIRETKSGETTYSVPVSFLRRWRVR